MTRRIFVACLLWLVAAPLRGAEAPEESSPDFLGEHAWTVPAWVQVRATHYPATGKSAAGLDLCYASARQVGCASVPYWIPEGSIIVIWSQTQRRVYLAVDQGRAVESRTAARKGKLDHTAPVIDFCASHQTWPDETTVQIYQYIGSTPYQKLSRQQKVQMMEYARRFISG